MTTPKEHICMSVGTASNHNDDTAAAGSRTETRSSIPLRCWLPVVILLFSSTFFQSFKPSTPYLPNFMNNVHGVSEEDINNLVMPFRTWGSLLAMLPMVYLAEFVIGYRVALAIGMFARISELLLLDFGEGIWILRLSQVCHGLASTTRTIHGAFTYIVVPQQFYQVATGFMRASNLLGQVLDGITGNLIMQSHANEAASIGFIYLFRIAEISVGLGMILLLTSFAILSIQNRSSASSASRTKHVAPNISSFQDLSSTLRRIFGSPEVLLWSSWWWTAYSVSTLVDDLDTTLFMAIMPDPANSQNGFVRSIVGAFAATAALSSGWSKPFFERHSFSVLVGGSALIGACLMSAALTENIWLAYFLIISASSLSEFTFVACYSSIARSTDSTVRGIALFVNFFLSLAFQSLIQLVCKQLNVSIRGKFLLLSCLLFMVALVVFFGFRVLRAKADAIKACSHKEETLEPCTTIES